MKTVQRKKRERGPRRRNEKLRKRERQDERKRKRPMLSSSALSAEKNLGFLREKARSESNVQTAESSS